MIFPHITPWDILIVIGIIGSAVVLYKISELIAIFLRWLGKLIIAEVIMIAVIFIFGINSYISFYDFLGIGTVIAGVFATMGFHNWMLGRQA